MIKFYPGWAEREPIPPDPILTRLERPRKKPRPVERELVVPPVTARPRVVPRARLDDDGNFWVKVTNRA